MGRIVQFRQRAGVAMAAQRLYMLAAFGAGWLITLMVLTNGTLGLYGTLLFSSWVPHATGSVVAIVLLLVLRPAKASPTPAPFWAYLGGVSGALTVVLTSAAMNSALALSGTIAIGLAGQVIFSLIADMRGMFGMPKHMPTLRDLSALGFILIGALVLVFFGGSA